MVTYKTKTSTHIASNGLPICGLTMKSYRVAEYRPHDTLCGQCVQQAYKFGLIHIVPVDQAIDTKTQ